MGQAPYRPLRELEGAIARGELDLALAIASEERRRRRRPLDLGLALTLLPLIARERTEDYDAWALRWLARWLKESGVPTIELAAEVAASLAELPLEGQVSLTAIREACRL